MRFSSTAAVLAAAAPLVVAQTSTDCDPTKKQCPSDAGLNAATYNADFTQGSSANASWSAAAYTFINYGSNGAEFTIAKEGQAPTVQTDFYIFFGRIDVKMKAAPGTGIVSSIVFESDDLDEIDWEFLGGNTAQVETNFFGKGNTTAYDRAIYYQVSSPQTQFHTYTLDWNSDRIEWIIDGVTVRTLAYTDPLTNGGQNYPQSPMRLKLGNWCGGCDGIPEGTVEWAGGKTTFDNAPYTMYVESIAIQNYNPADSYEYGDMSGSWESIKIIKGDKSSTPTGSAASVVPTASATAASTSGSYLAGNGTAVSAPTSSASVAGIQQQSVAAVPTKKTGSAYSTNTASVSAQNDGTPDTTVIAATTEVPGSTPTGYSDSGIDGSSIATTGGSTATSSGPATQTGTSGASVNNVLTAGSLLSVAMGFFML
ncbi:hypothetical protein LTR53_000231 [Teratosphaeriaceae sp. CCFEE 6253]|nr:hypothetical protein LTR53_000231 [Teratosphaeriaceae sp. CCFEE 6253]